MKRTCWTGRLVAGLAIFAALNGCKQQLFMEPADWQDGIKTSPQLSALETQPHEAIIPTRAAGPAPATVLDPSRTPQPMTLKQAIAIALEQGNLGSGFVNAGFTSDQLPQFTGRGISFTDNLRSFTLDPAIAAAEIERATSKFDARLITSMTWSKVDQPVLSLQQSFSNGDTAQLQSTLAKPLPTGGVAGITFSTQYLNLSTPPTNPQFVALSTSYTPRIQFTFEQPLLQAFGVEINQLLPSHPGSQLIQGGLRPSGGQGSEGILVTRIRLDQQKAQLDSQINQLLLSVEAAYWNLFSAYYNLAAQEEGLKQSLDAYLYYRTRAERGLARDQVALQALTQYYQFAAATVQARGQVLTSERNLRGILGMSSDANTRLVPIDEPTLVPYSVDWNAAHAEAMQFRPELVLARQELKARQLDLMLQKNLRRPDLRFISSYDLAGLGSRLDGRNTPEFPNENALESLATNQFNSWTLGLRLDMPIGFRDANALVRQARLNMERGYLQLIDSERKAGEFLVEQIRRVEENHQLIVYRRLQRKAAADAVELDKQIRTAGAITREEATAFILQLIQSQQQLATATAQEFQAVAQYNIALASLEFAKGTIQRYNNVTVSDGPLPPHVGKKAADHFAARDAALKLREHPSETMLPYVNRSPLTDAEIAAQAAAAGVPPPPAMTGNSIPSMPSTIAPSTPLQPDAPTPIPLNPGKQPDPATPGKQPLPINAPPQSLPSASYPGTSPAMPSGSPPASSFKPVGSVVLPTRPSPGATSSPAGPAEGTPISVPDVPR